MPSRRKKSKAVPFNATEVANIAKANPYVQRLIEDAKLRANIRTAIDSTKSAYGRLTNGKTPTKALLEDKKLQRDLEHSLTALRDAATALTEAPKKRVRKGRRLARRMMIVGLGAGLALASSEKVRSKVLDTLFGAEEEFDYTPPPSTAAPPPTSTVGAA